MRKIVSLSILWVMLAPSFVHAVSIDEIDNIQQQMNNVAEQTSSTVNKAKQLIRVATTTAGIAVDAYNKTEKAVSSTVEVVKRGSAVYNNLMNIFDKIGSVWNVITNNNEFWRVSVVVVGIILFWFVIRFAL